jgi:hypothetical protein
MHRTRAIAVGALMLVVLATSACSPGQNAVMGVTGDKDGRPVGVVAVCSGAINTASLGALIRPSGTVTGPEPDITPPATARPDLLRPLEWRSPEPVTDVGLWSLTTGEPWAGAETPTLVDGVTYSLSANDVTYRDGGTVGINSYARSVEFTLADVAALEPGQVRFVRDYADDLTVIAEVVDVNSFRDSACRR